MGIDPKNLHCTIIGWSNAIASRKTKYQQIDLQAFRKICFSLITTKSISFSSDDTKSFSALLVNVPSKAKAFLECLLKNQTTLQLAAHPYLRPNSSPSLRPIRKTLTFSSAESLSKLLQRDTSCSFTNPSVSMRRVRPSPTLFHEDFVRIGRQIAKQQTRQRMGTIAHVPHSVSMPE